jgi:lambda repressor-like predicted transcriptional regulator
MAAESVAAAGASGWIIGKILDAVTAPLRDVLDDIELRRAVSNAIDRAKMRLIKEAASPQDRAYIHMAFSGASPILFALALERLNSPAPNKSDPVSLTAHFAMALNENAAEYPEAPQSVLELIAGAFDAELWSKAPLVQHRVVLSGYIREQHLLQLTENLIPDSRPSAILARARHSAFADASKRFFSAHQTGPIVPRTLTHVKEDKPQSISMDAFADAISATSASAVIDTGGVGKSTALALLADTVMRRQTSFCAAMVPLEEIAGAGAIFDALVRRDAFLADKVTAEDFAFLARNGQLALLLDGWNELARDERRAVRKLISQFRDDYPMAAIVLASRPSSSPPPIGSSNIYELDRLSRKDQINFVTGVAGASGVAALEKAHSDRRIKDLLSLPFFLSLFAQLPWGEDGPSIPTSSAALLNAFVKSEFAKPAYMDAPAYLSPDALKTTMQAIAIAMVATDRMQISIDDAAAAIEKERDGSSPLSDDQTADIIEALIDNSLMRAATNDSARVIRFNHELFRDWFAAGDVAAAIQTCADDAETPTTAMRQYGDRRQWTGAIGLAVETLADDDALDAGLKRFILEMCGVDSLFAADLLSRLNDQGWKAIVPQIREFLDAWTKDAGAKIPFLFMVKTGRPEFAEDSWRSLAAGEDYGRYGGVTDGRRFDPRVLGDDWRAQIAKAPVETQRAIIHDLAYYGGEKGLSMAAAAALDDLETDHIGFVLDELYYRSQEGLAAEIIGGAPDEVWDRWAVDTRFSSLAVAIDRNRLIAALDRLSGQIESDLRMRAIIAKCELTGEEPTDEAIAFGLALDEKSRDHHSRWAESFHKLAPEKLSRTILSQLIGGDRAPFRSERYLAPLASTDRDALFKSMTAPNKNPFGYRKLARFLSADQLRTILEEYQTISAKFDRQTGAYNKALYDRYHQLSELLDNADHNVFVRVLTKTPARSSQDAALLLRHLRRWSNRDDGEEKHLNTKGVRLLALAQRVDEWCRVILDDSDVPRARLADAALGLARLKRRQSLPLIKELLDRELDLHAAELEELKRNRAEAHHGSGSAHMYYDNLFRQAFDELRSDQARETLLSYIGDPRFEVEAARGLLSYAPHRTADIVGERSFGITASVLRRRRAAFIERPTSAACHVVAAMVLDRMKAIERDDAGWKRLRELAPSAAAMDCGPRLLEIIELIESDPNPRGSVRTLEALSHAGHPIASTWIKPGLDAAEKEYFNLTWRSDNEFYILRPWLDLLAMSDDPLDLAKRLASYPKSLTGWRVRDYLTSLVVDDPETELKAIEAFSAMIPERDNGHTRTEALLRNGSPDAMERLLEDTLNARTQPRWLYSRGETAPLPHYIETTPGRLQQIMKQIDDDPERETKLARLTDLAGGFLSPQSFQTVIDGVDAALGAGWEQLLEVMLDGQCLQREPIGPMSYEVRQRSVGELRRDLWRRARDGQKPNPIWSKLLSRVEDIVIGHGGHPDDPRHPDIATGGPYPDAAAKIWGAGEIKTDP